MRRALFAAVVLGLVAAPAFASIQGATCTTSDPYVPGGTATMCWTCSNGGPTSPDPECIDQIALGHPDGWTVSCNSQDAADSGGSPVAFGCTASGQTVTFADTDGGAGEICPERTWSFCVDVTALVTAPSPTCVFYTLSGDGAGSEPHEIIDCGTCLAAQGSVTIVKQTLPAGSGELFAFAGDLGAFSLTGGQSNTVSNLAPGTYAVSEAVPAGWDLTQITCVDPDGGSTFNLATASASIDLDAGEHVTCTFLNTAQGSVTIVKETMPAGSGQLFAFAGDLGAFSLTGGQSNTVSNLGPGTYAIAETLPAGWQLTQITCVDPDGGSTFNLATASASIDLDPGEHVTCTFLNTAQGSVTIVKETVPAGSGQLFAFAGDLGAFSLTGGQSNTVSNLGPGTYDVTETLPAGWQLTQITCVDPDGGSTFNLATASASIDLDAGEHVTCTFLNTAQGSVTIVKETVPQNAGGQLFAFAGDLGAFSLTGGQSNTVSNLGPGTYDVTETLPAGWELTQITCVDPDGGSTSNLTTASASIDLDGGEHVTCTFLNTATESSSVTIVKQTAPAGSGQLFAFSGDLGAFSLTGGQSNTVSDLTPGTYAVTEAVSAGWDLTQITCVDPDGGSTVDLATASASIDLDAGEHVTCTFLNAMTASSVTIVKQTAPAGSAESFAFSGGLGVFSLSGGQSNTVSDLTPGTYAVTEAVSAGWDLTQITCVDPDGGSTFDLATASASIDLDAGEHVTCTFLNTAAESSSVTIVKQTVPAGSGEIFAFSGDLGAFSLSGGQSNTVSDLAPGTYAVTEAVSAGWDLTQITCVDPDGGSTFDLATASASIDLDAGEHITCTFLNSEQGAVTIVKQTVPAGSGQLFAFSGDLGAFSLTGGQSNTTSNLGLGTYAVTETLPAGWELTQITCVDPDGGSTFDLATASASIDLDAGEHVTCTFLNTATEASVTIVKQTLPAGSGEIFAFSGSLGSFSLSGGESRTVGGLEPGMYTVIEEVMPPGWHLVDISCADPDGGSVSNLAASTATIDLDAGEQLTCTFVNQSADYVPPTPIPIPTLSTWMLLLLVGVLSILGILVIRSRIAG